MERFWRPLSTNIDEDGLEFISTLEAKKYPIFATQGCLFSDFYIYIFYFKKKLIKSVEAVVFRKSQIEFLFN